MIPDVLEYSKHAKRGGEERRGVTMKESVCGADKLADGWKGCFRDELLGRLSVSLIRWGRVAADHLSHYSRRA